MMRPTLHTARWTRPIGRSARWMRLAVIAGLFLIPAAGPAAAGPSGSSADPPGSTSEMAPTSSDAADGSRGVEVSLRLPASYRSWTMKAGGANTKVSQLYVPITASFRIAARADVVISGCSGFSSLKPDSGRTLSLNGPGDVTAQVFWRTPGNRLLVQAGVNVPTGKRKLDVDELTVSQELGHPLLAFRLKQYGKGLDTNAGLAVALPVAPGVTFGLGGGHIFRGPYALGEGTPDFEPSSETAISTGLEFGGENDQGPSARLDAVHRLYGKDRQNGADIFEQGDQTELQIWARTGNRGPGAEVSARYVNKADDRYLAALTQGEPQAARPGNYLRLAGSAETPLGGRWRAGLDLEWTSFSGSDFAYLRSATHGAGLNGSTYGVGPRLRCALGQDGALTLGGSYLKGTLDAADRIPKNDLSGFSLFGALAWRTGR